MCGAQKPSFAGGFDGESQRQATAREKFQAVMATPMLRQSGTETIVPNRYDDSENLYLSAPFVAQLLGQVMPVGAPPLAQARAAYRSIEQQHAALLDARL